MLNSDAYLPWASTDPHLVHLRPHPTNICEPINLAATELPSLRYTMASSPFGISTMQEETVRRAMQSFDQRGAFLLGDATGVGKGRTIAAVIMESSAKSPCKVAWISASIRLESEARAELDVVGADQHLLMFESYSGILSSSRENKLYEFLRGSAQSLLVLDECHLLRNDNSVASQVIEALIGRLSNVNILYSSATACSHVRHMNYLGRLGVYGTDESPFPTFDALTRAVKRHGSSLMELLAIDLRTRGAYVARQLSFEKLEIVHHQFHLEDAQRRVYDECVARLRALPRHGIKQQSFFQRLITAFKVNEVIRLTEYEVACGNSVVISLVNTGEAAARRAAAREDGYEYVAPLNVDDDAEDTHDIELPMNPLDALVLHFGERMVELSGRRQRLVHRSGHTQLERAPPLRDQASLFTSGQRHVAVLSRAGGTGISLHDATDGRRRVHVLMEIPWSAEDLLQQMGRTHRSNSKKPPKYILVSTDVPAEMRFAFSISQKLRTFGALIKADRSSCAFSFLSIPRWTAADKRSIALYFSMAKAVDAKDIVPAITRDQALSACGLDKRTGDAAAKTRIVHMLSHHEELGERRLTVVAAALRLYPNDTTMLLERWTIDKHPLFPFAFKRQVMTLLLCSRALETASTLGALSTDLLLYIVQWLACPISIERAKRAADALPASMLADLPGTSMDHVLNRLLGVELAVQNDLFCVADALVHPQRDTPSPDLLRYATERAGACTAATIKDVAFCRFGAVDGVRVELTYEIRRPREPPVGAQFLRHASGRRIAWFYGGLVVFSDGVQIRLDDETQMRARDFYACRRNEWNMAVERIALVAQRRARRLPTTFYLATRFPLRHWEASDKKVLRVPPSTQLPQGIVGLLMHRGRCGDE